MTPDEKRGYRDRIKLICAYLFIWYYLPHIIMLLAGDRKTVYADVEAMMGRQYIKCSSFSGFLFLCHSNRYFRTLFYHRLGPVRAMAVSWLRPGDRYFIIPVCTKVGKGCRLAHPYSTVLNAKSIGENFVVRHCTTLGKKDEIAGGLPTVGDNVTVGASATIIGEIKIGDYAIVGAGSVVVKDVPPYAIVAGNPARILGYRNPQ